VQGPLDMKSPCRLYCPRRITWNNSNLSVTVSYSMRIHY